MSLINQILKEAIYKEDVESSNLHSVRYDDEQEILLLKFLNGSVYEYYDVPEEVYDELITADSKGSYAYHNICYNYVYNKIKTGKKYKKVRRKKLKEEFKFQPRKLEQRQEEQLQRKKKIFEELKNLPIGSEISSFYFMGKFISQEKPIVIDGKLFVKVKNEIARVFDGQYLYFCEKNQTWLRILDINPNTDPYRIVKKLNKQLESLNEDFKFEPRRIENREEELLNKIRNLPIDSTITKNKNVFCTIEKPIEKDGCIFVKVRTDLSFGKDKSNEPVCYLYYENNSFGSGWWKEDMLNDEGPAYKALQKIKAERRLKESFKFEPRKLEQRAEQKAKNDKAKEEFAKKLFDEFNSFEYRYTFVITSPYLQEGLQLKRLSNEMLDITQQFSPLNIKGFENIITFWYDMERSVIRAGYDQGISSRAILHVLKFKEKKDYINWLAEIRNQQIDVGKANPMIDNLNEEFKFQPRRIQSREEEKTKKLERLLQQTHIEGDLDLRDTKITSLGNLKSVGGSLYLNGTNVTSLGNLRSVGGYLDLGGTKITSLGNLESVGGFLDLYNTNITSLGNLKSVGGYLSLRGTKITSLGKLKFVVGVLNLIGCTNLTSLGNLKSVGGYLYLNGNITYIDPSIIIKSSIYKGQKVFKSIESFNEYYKDKQNLKEEFKFEPRRLNDRKILFSDIKSKYLDYLKQNTFTDRGIYNTLKELGVKKVLKQNVYSYFINSEGKKVPKKGFKTIYVEFETGVRIHSQYLKQFLISFIEKMPDTVFLNFWNKNNGTKYVFSDDRNYVVAKV